MNRIAAPTFAASERKGAVWLAKPMPGRHSTAYSVSLRSLIRDWLKLAVDAREAESMAGLGQSDDAHREPELRPGHGRPGTYRRRPGAPVARPINEELRRLRLADTGIDEAAVEDLFTWLDVEGVGLVKVDEKTGELLEARKSNEAAAFGIPFGVAMLMFILVMMGATPLLQSVMEEKNMKIAEVILGSVRPFDFMLGKVLGGLAVTLTGSSVYIAAALFSLTTMGLSDIFPLHIIPWFFVYLLLMIVMMGSVLAALGSACNDAKDAQNLAFPGMIPMLAPMFVLVPVIKEPTSAFSFWASMIPPFTPMLMVLRMSTSTALGWWGPWIGLAGVLAATALAVWTGGRIFRIGILMQGQPPNFGQILRWAIRG